MASRVNKTAPKPFVFVLMPFSPEFDDVYTFGIRGAAEDAGAYAERVDEQNFTDGILDRIFNQINKADVIVADMTGRNPNVFYEVGYAHALGKAVLLLTQNADDIPFDLKHRPHTVYGGKIATLRTELAKKIRWAIRESQRQAFEKSSEQLLLSIGGQILPEAHMRQEPPVVFLDSWAISELLVEVRNEAGQSFMGATHIYLMAEADADFIPCRVIKSKLKRPVYEQDQESGAEELVGEEEIEKSHYEPLAPLSLLEVDAMKKYTRQYRLPSALPMIPVGAIDQIVIPLKRFMRWDAITTSSLFRLRIHSGSSCYDYDFHIHPGKPEAKKH